jgi:hypothetical protein
MKVSLQGGGLKMPSDPVPHNAPALKVVSPGGKLPLMRAPKVHLRKEGFNANKVGMFGSRAMKSPEDYETGAATSQLGKIANPYFAEQYAKNGQSLKYDTATNTYR